MRVAEDELAAAMNELQVVKESGKAEKAEELVSKRVEVEPLKARVAAAEKFLKKFSDGAKVIARVEKLKSAISLLEKDRQIYANEL